MEKIGKLETIKIDTIRYNIKEGSTFTMNEHHLYGSSRLGMEQKNEFLAFSGDNIIIDSLRTTVYTDNDSTISTTFISSSIEAEDTTFTALDSVWIKNLGWKKYELSNHLGNVMTVISDRKLGIDSTENDTADYYLADVVSATDYYPFGMTMPGRQYVTASPTTGGYRFGFNGKEKDDEGMGGGGSTYDYGFRIYNPQLGKFLSVDPLKKKYPMLSTYQYASNTPIQAIDLDGLEAAVVTTVVGKIGKLETTKTDTIRYNIQDGSTFTLNEHHLYGSSRLGMEQKNEFLAFSGDNLTIDSLRTTIYSYNDTTINTSYLTSNTEIEDTVYTEPDSIWIKNLGLKKYELSNHLGNVMVVISDRKLGVDSIGNDIADYYLSDVISATDYYPFGMVMPERSYTSENYRFGFNGMEKDGEEWSGNAGSSYDFGARIYDSRLGRWLSLDPLMAKYPNLSPYHSFANNPVLYIDQEGKENVIYLVVLPSARLENGGTWTDKQIEQLIAKTNNDLCELGLNTRVALFTDKEPINTDYLDKTDGIAVLGSTADVKSYINENIPISSSYDYDLNEDWNGGVYEPEISENSLSQGGVVALSSEGVKGESNVYYTSWILMHGLGHNTGENHKDDGVNRSSSLIMISGKGAFEKIVNKSIFNHDGLKKKGDNKSYIESMEKRFGTNSAKPNYFKKKLLNVKPVSNESIPVPTIDD